MEESQISRKFVSNLCLTEDTILFFDYFLSMQCFSTWPRNQARMSVSFGCFVSSGYRVLATVDPEIFALNLYALYIVARAHRRKVCSRARVARARAGASDQLA